jgi:hypothetical protein
LRARSRFTFSRGREIEIGIASDLAAPTVRLNISLEFRSVTRSTFPFRKQ